MIIAKQFKFENAHIVRNCFTRRCRENIHGHSYKVEVQLKADGFDNGQMIYDFGLMKGALADAIDSFDHAITFWDKDDAGYIESCKKYSERWISLPVSPSAEQFARVIFAISDAVLQAAEYSNGEQNVELFSVIVWETATAYAQAFRDDHANPKMTLFGLCDIKFSEQIKSEWKNRELLCSVFAAI